MKALSGGKEGFQYVGRVLTILLQTLLKDDIAAVSSTSHYNIMEARVCSQLVGSIQINWLYMYEGLSPKI